MHGVVVPPAWSEKRGTSSEARLRRGLFRMLTWVENNQPTGVVRVRTEAAQVGCLAVSQGRLCLAFPTSNHVTDRPTHEGRVAEESGSRNELFRLAHEAQLRGGTLADAVGGETSTGRFRDALLEETALGLAAILTACGGGDPALDATPARNDYDERLTLGLVEVFVATLGTLFAVPADVARQTLEAIGETGCALFLVRSGEPGEQPFPVAQAGFGDKTLRELVDAVRVAREISRPVARTGVLVETSITTFTHSGERWRSVAGETRAVLLKTPPESLEKATAWAHIFASSRPGTI